MDAKIVQTKILGFGETKFIKRGWDNSHLLIFTMAYITRQTTPIAISVKNKKQINSYVNELELKTQDQVVTILLNLAKKFPKELVKQARGEFE